LEGACAAEFRRAASVREAVLHGLAAALPTIAGMNRDKTSPSRAKVGDGPTQSVPAAPDHGENSASTIVEAPLKPRRGRLDAHDFPDGGGSGGAEAFSREHLAKKSRTPR
jgi:hypothetical protein